MTSDNIANERALKLYEVALSLLRLKGTVKLDGLASGLEYRGRLLNIEWRLVRPPRAFGGAVLRQAAGHPLPSRTLGAASD